MRKLSLLLFLVACGDDGIRHTPDATVHDAARDGAPDSPADASPGAVTLTVTHSGSGVPGVNVYFQNADDSLVLATMTDANGTASAVMAAGGSVTAIEPALGFYGRAPDDDIETFLGVKPGDQLHLDHDFGTQTTVTYTGPVSMNANVASYKVYSPCFTTADAGVGLGSSPSTTLGLVNCGATTDFLQVAYDASGNALEYMRATGVAVPANGTVDLSAQTYTAMTAQSFSYTNVPANWGQPSIDTVLATLAGRAWEAQLSGSTGSATSYPVPAFTGAIDIVTTQMFNGTAGMQAFIDWGAFSSTYTLDVGARALTDITGQPSYVPATHQVTIGEGSGGVTPDFARFIVQADRASTKFWTWTIAAPHAATVTLPTLPTTVYDYNISATDQLRSVSVLVGKVPGGYDAIRGQLVTETSFLKLIASLTGSMTIEQNVLALTGTPSGKPAVLRHRTR